MHQKRKNHRYCYTLCWVLGLMLLTMSGHYAQAQDKSGVPTVKMRRQKKKVKRVNPNRPARRVKDNHRAAPSQPTNFPHKDQYRPPASRKNSGKVKEQPPPPPAVSPTRAR